jgi:hypothetical protein
MLLFKRRGWRRTCLASHECLDALFKLAAREQDAALARLANDANVRAKSHYLPFVSTARMRLA